MKTENPKGSTSEPRCVTCGKLAYARCDIPGANTTFCGAHFDMAMIAGWKPALYGSDLEKQYMKERGIEPNPCPTATAPTFPGVKKGFEPPLAEQPAAPSPGITVIKLQSEYPRDFVCYECKDNNHTHCVGVPCNCKCPAQPALEPADQSSTGKELVWMDESHGRWAVFVGNVFCGYELSEERAKDKVAALLEAIQESIAAPMEAFTAEPAQSSSGCCANSWGSCSPAVVTTGFTVTIKFHTADADRALLSPDLVRRRIGAVLDTCGNIQEEIDYTLEVTRNYD